MRTRQGKKCEYVAEKGFRTLGEITPLWTVQRVYEEIRTEFQENDREKEVI